MTKKKKGGKDEGRERYLKPETMRSIIGVLFLVAAVFFLLSAFHTAGPAGELLFRSLTFLLGVGYYLLPLLLFLLTLELFRSQESARPHWGTVKATAAVFFLVSSLSLIELLFHGKGGLMGSIIALPLKKLVDTWASLAIMLGLLIAALMVLFDTHIRLHAEALAFWKRRRQEREAAREEEESEEAEEEEETADEEEEGEEAAEEPAEEEKEKDGESAPAARGIAARAAGLKKMLGLKEDAGGVPLSAPYTPPPLSLLSKDKNRPQVGDTKANANIIKRTLQNFNIPVEMDEISVGPTVTRYALKPAEGVRISRIVSLQSNLELALAASPIRIEAPIPGKSLVGIEVPNTARATVGLYSLLTERAFTESKRPLIAALGRDITGVPYYLDIAKMPHGLIAGATGSGKSVTTHSIITSLLYRNSPHNLRFIMVDRKRVELTLYNNIPHLLTPVITEPKQAVLALKWAVNEMDRRYNILEAERVSNISSYYENVLAPALRKEAERNSEDEGDAEEAMEAPEPMPYIIIVIDEMAELMQTYPREVESAVVRLAQMSRAVGIHLLLSTQRPSVNVITGLIKANVPTRIALQVSSQIDSRTIIDSGGAEKLLGSGDMLYVSGETAKPVRLQSSFISEAEIKKVVDYLIHHNRFAALDTGIDLLAQEEVGSGGFAGSLNDETDDDPKYAEAKETVIHAGKASTAFLQRKLGIGYSRAARIMDLLEERGIIGPSNGSKPREVLVGRDEDTEAHYREGEDAAQGGAFAAHDAADKEETPERG